MFNPQVVSLVIFCGYYGQSQNLYPNYYPVGVNNSALPIPYHIPQFGPPNLGPTPYNPYMFGLSNPQNGTYPPFGPFQTQTVGEPTWNPYMLPQQQPGQMPFGMPYPGGYPQPPQQYSPYGLAYPGLPQPYGNINNGGSGNVQPPNDGKLAVEIIDVSPEYQRQLLGWPSQSGDATSDDTAEPRWTVEFQGKNATNQTYFIQNFSRPVVKHEERVASFKRSFVFDSSKPANFTPIIINLNNGNLVTTTPPPTTTEDEYVDAVDSWYDNEV